MCKRSAQDEVLTNQTEINALFYNNEIFGMYRCFFFIIFDMIQYKVMKAFRIIN